MSAIRADTVVMALVDLLVEAHRSGHRMALWEEPVAASMEEAYAISDHVLERTSVSGAADAAAFKVAATSPEFQRLIGVPHPIFGRLSAERVIMGDAVLQLDAERFPVLEPEIVFVVHGRIGPEHTRADILLLTSRHAGFEIPEMRFHDWFKKVGPTVLAADNGAAGLLVVGPALDDEVDPRDVVLTLRDEDHRESETRHDTSAVMGGDPVQSVLWLVAELSRRGHVVTDGLLIASGTLTAPIPTVAGRFVADFSGAGVGLEVAAASSTTDPER